MYVQTFIEINYMYIYKSPESASENSGFGSGIRIMSRDSSYIANFLRGSLATFDIHGTQNVNHFTKLSGFIIFTGDGISMETDAIFFLL